MRVEPGALLKAREIAKVADDLLNALEPVARPAHHLTQIADRVLHVDLFGRMVLNEASQGD